MRRRILQALTLVLIVVGFFAGLITLAHWARDDLRHRDRNTLAFNEIDCMPPPGMSRRDFLDEVQYDGSMPKQLSLLDDDLTPRQRGARPDGDAAAQRVDRHDVLRHTARDADAAPLPDREAMHAVVRADYLALRVDHLAGRDLGVAGHEPGVVAIGDEADFL